MEEKTTRKNNEQVASDARYSEYIASADASYKQWCNNRSLIKNLIHSIPNGKRKNENKNVGVD